MENIAPVINANNQKPEPILKNKNLVRHFKLAQEKKKAEIKFIDIAAAKEVLTDPGNIDIWNNVI